MSTQYSEDELIEALKTSDNDILIHDGRYGPTVIRTSNGDSEFAMAFFVTTDSSREGENTKLSSPSMLEEKEVREYITEAFDSDIDVELVDPESSTSSVYNMSPLSRKRY